MIIHACTLSLESRSRGIAVSVKPACTTQWVPDYPARLCPTHNMTNKAGQTKPDYTVLSSTFSAWHPLWLPCLLGKCHSLWTIWSLGICHIPAHSTHFLGLYDRGLTNSFGDHPQWEGGGITWSCYGSQSHLFRRANTHQWRVNATDWEGSPAQVSVGTYPHTLWIFPPSPTSQQGLVDLLRHLFSSWETLPFPLLTKNSIFSFFTLSHNDTQLCWQVYILSLVLTTWKQNKMNYEPMTMFGSRVP